MRIGLIARCEIARGIAIQSHNFYTHMPVERVLLVRMPRPDCMEHPDWYKPRLEVPYDARHHQLPEHQVREWLDGLDVVFTVETPNDWRIPLWCREQGVKLVIQGNPEFYRHGRPGHEDLAHPDEWWWPTSWRTSLLPPGRLMPVPMDPRSNSWIDDGLVRILHVIGKRAWADRNGTDLLIQALPMVEHDIEMAVHTIDEGLPEFTRRPNLHYRFEVNPVYDQWSMYTGQHLLILPRRYGGLCLPALEASAMGVPVAMPNCPPNNEFATLSFPGVMRRSLNLSCGPVPEMESDATRIAATIDLVADAVINGRFPTMSADQQNLLPTWDVWAPRYLQAFEEVCS
jgi:glycosyltransferase involved in cell wall biosynthesis